MTSTCCTRTLHRQPKGSLADKCRLGNIHRDERQRAREEPPSEDSPARHSKNRMAYMMKTRSLHLSPSELHHRLADQAPLRLTYRGQPFRPWQIRLRKKVIELLCSVPDTKCPLNVRELEHRETEDYTQTKLVYTGEPYSDVPCYLLIPTHVPPPIPVCICLQGHSTGMHISIGLAKYRGDKASLRRDGDYALQAIKEGFAALCIEQRCYGEREETRQKLRWRHGCVDATMHSLAMGRTMIREKVYDVQRGIDMLQEEYPQVDTSRIAITGCSGGGMTAFWTAALDGRISAAMPQGYFCTCAGGGMKTPHCVEIYVPGILAWMEKYDVAGLIAPRPLVIVTGKEDPIYPLSAVRKAYRKAKAIYGAAGAAGNIRLVVGEGGHRFYKYPAWKILKKLMG